MEIVKSNERAKIMIEYNYRGEANEKVPTNATNIKVAPSVKKIGEKAFYGCSSLTRINIPPSVKEIEIRAFVKCSSLVEIDIPPSVKTIGRGTFFGCSSLTRINIPPSVEEIGEEAFHGCSSLTRINIPSSVKKIGDSVFGYCHSLVEIDIPSSVKEIGYGAFYECSSLETVYLSKKCDFKLDTFYCSVKLVYSWDKVGPYILLHELIKKERATARLLHEDDTHIDLLVIQKFIANTNDDIFRNVMEYLMNN